MIDDSHLARELATYEERLVDLIAADEGKYVIIYKDNIAGISDSYANALKMGYKKFNRDHFLVKKISANELVSFFSREIGATSRI